MLLSYVELQELARAGVIEGVDPDSINSSSIDLTLGVSALRECRPPAGTFLSLRNRDPLTVETLDLTDGVVLYPGDFLLAQSREVFNLPPDISAEYKLKSSMARIAIEHLNAGWCLVGSTEVPLFGGDPHTRIADLVGDTPTIFCLNADGVLVPGKATRVWESARVHKTVEVVLDDGNRFECTPEHPVMKLAGGYCNAGDLVPGMPLYPLCRTSACAVQSVMPIYHRRAVPVYDITVAPHHNFALGAGVFVHNCDAGWNGSVLTLELKNLSLYHPTQIQAGDKIGQIVFFPPRARPR